MIKLSNLCPFQSWHLISLDQTNLHPEAMYRSYCYRVFCEVGRGDSPIEGKWCDSELSEKHNVNLLSEAHPF